MAVSTVQLVQLLDRNVQLLMVVIQEMQKSHQVSVSYNLEKLLKFGSHLEKALNLARVLEKYWNFFPRHLKHVRFVPVYWTR